MSAAFERRARPIYDALDSRNYKNALKLVNGALEKHPNNDLLNALKAIALQRMGRVEEAHQLCDLVVGHSPTDDMILHPLKLVLKDLHRLSDITRLYEAAHEKDPKDGDTLEKLFGSYVREFSYVKQQQAAMKLLKLSGGADIFQWWIITTLMLQARAALLGTATATATGTAAPATPALDPSKLLQLAESMVGRAVAKEGKLDNFEALLLWVDLLLAAGKAKEAADVLSAPAAANVASMAAERSMLHADLLMAGGELQAAAELLREQLRSNPDDWSALQGYFDVVLPGSRAPGWLPGGCSSLAWLSGGTAEAMELSGKSQRAGTQKPRDENAPGAAPPGAPDVASALEDAKALVKELVGQVGPLSGVRVGAVAEGVAGGGVSAPQQARLTMRGPHLARVELAWRAFRVAAAREVERTKGDERSTGGERTAAEAAQQAVAEAVMAYYGEAGHLPSCAADLRPYLSQMEGAARGWLGQQLQTAAALGSSSTPAAEGAAIKPGDVARRRVCALQMMDDLGLPELGSEGEAVTHAVALMRLFAECVPLYTGLDVRERGPADELPPLAAASLVTAAARAPTPATAARHLRHAVLLLEAATATRPHSAALRLPLAALYCLLGCPERVASHVQSLHIKHIQLDTLGSHHLLPALLAFEVPITEEGEGSKGGGSSMLLGAGGPQPLLRRLLRDSSALFDDHTKEAGDSLLQAFKSRTYSKVLEFVSFKERLDASHTRAVITAEAALSEGYTGLLERGAPGLAGGLLQGVAGHMGSTAVPCCRPAVGGKVLRFNEDLGTRPAWYDPCAAALHLAPAEWWKGRGAHSGQGFGRRWWAMSGAADSSETDRAVQMRAARLRHVSVAWAAVHVLAGSLAAVGVPAASAANPHLLPLPAAVSALARACGTGGDSADGASAAADLGAWVQRASEGVIGPSCSSVEALEVAVLAAAASAATALGPSASQAEAAAAASSLQVLQQLGERLCSSLVSTLAAETQGDQGQVVGGTLALAAAVVQRPLAWLVGLVEAWGSALRAQRSKGKGKGDAGASAADTITPVTTSVRGWVSQALTDVGNSLTKAASQAKAPAAAATAVMEPACAAVQADTAALWSWQPPSSGFVASDVALKLVKEQGVVAARLQAVAHKLGRQVDKLPQLK